MNRLENLCCIAALAGVLLFAGIALAEDTPPPTSPGGPAACKENPGKCDEARAKREAYCKENPEKCEQMKERRAKREAYCQQNPEKCEQQRARMKQRHEEMQAKCAADPEKCEEMKQSRRERFKKRFGDGDPAEATPD